MQTTKSYRNLWMYTLVATITLLVTGYLYYNVISETPAETSGWAYKILYTLIFSFGLGYLFWKTKRIGDSRLTTGLVVGFIVSMLILAATRLVFLNSNETIICCQGSHCWVWVIQTMLATTAMALTGGRTQGGDDD